MAGLPLTVATWNYDRTHAIATGEVGIEGCDVRFLNLPILDIFWRGIRHQEFDVCEMSFSSYCMMTSRGESAYVAVPVFLSRLFRHSCIYIRTDRGIDTPADLKGRVIGVPEYQVSAALWSLTGSSICPAKEGVKNIAKAAEVEALKASPPESLATTMPKAVISGALIRVREHFIGFIHLLKPVLGSIIAVMVGMIFKG